MKTLFTCACEDVSHQFIMEFDSDSSWNDCIFVYIHLNHLPFWQRLRYAFFYILGKRSANMSAFDEIILDQPKTKEFIETLIKCYYKMPNVTPIKLDQPSPTLDQTVL